MASFFLPTNRLSVNLGVAGWPPVLTSAPPATNPLIARSVALRRCCYPGRRKDLGYSHGCCRAVVALVAVQGDEHNATVRRV
jgi:hypothetical protein